MDGIENRILRGASSVLKNQTLKSVLVELDSENTDHKDEVVELMEKNNFKRKVEVGVTNSEASRFSEIHNHIFYREVTT